MNQSSFTRQEMPNVDQCPHCQQEITQEQVDEIQKKKAEEKLWEEFRSSREFKDSGLGNHLDDSGGGILLFKILGSLIVFMFSIVLIDVHWIQPHVERNSAEHFFLLFPSFLVLFIAWGVYSVSSFLKEMAKLTPYWDKQDALFKEFKQKHQHSTAQ